MACESVEEHGHECQGRRIRGNLICGREEIALQRGSEGKLQPRVLGDQFCRRAGGEGIELADVKWQSVDDIGGICFNGLELGDHLLDPEALPERDTNGWWRDGRRNEYGNDLIDRHRPGDDMAAELEASGHIFLNGLEDERPSILDRTSGHELVADLVGRLSGGDDHHDCRGVVGLNRCEARSQLTTDEVRDEGQLLGSRVLGGPTHDAIDHDRAGHEVQPAHDDAAHDRYKESDPEDATRPPGSAPAIVPPRIECGRPAARCDLLGVGRTVVIPARVDDSALGLIRGWLLRAPGPWLATTTYRH